VRVPLRAGAAPGKALCTVEVEGGAERYRDSIEMPVRPAAGMDVAAQTGALKAGERWAVPALTNWVPETLRREVWCTGQPSIKLGRGLDYLLNYPYGCIEQTVSASFPLLYLSDLANRALPHSMGREETQHFVQDGIWRMLSMQQSDGSFSAWPYSRETYPWGSLYAANFLAEARKAAYDVPPDRLDAALRWLRERLDQKAPVMDESPTNAAWQADMEQRAYACYVLALAGQPEHGWASRLGEAAPHLTFGARVLTASALMLGGEPRQATSILGALGLPGAGGGRQIGGALNSSVRDAAWLLSAWLDVDPRHADVVRLVQWLDGQQHNGHWDCTQDDAMALLAMGKYCQRIPADDTPFVAHLDVPGEAGLTFTSTQAMHWVASTGVTAGFVLRNDGPGTLYYAERSEGVPMDGRVPEADHGIAVRHQWMDVNSNTVAYAALAQGDLVIVKITLDTLDRDLDNVVIEELLPAGIEIENSNLATAETVPWIKEKTDWCAHREIRDDRLILFTGPVHGAATYYYAARAVTPGKYVYPPITASCMYDPETRSVHGRAQVEVKP
jgi:alpha-2-macroglobulin